MAVEAEADSAGFDAVVEFGGCPVKVYVLHRLTGQSGFLESQTHGARGFLTALLKSHAVVSLAGGSVAGDLAVDVRAAGAGARHRFHKKEPRPFAQHKTISVGGERAP